MQRAMAAEAEATREARAKVSYFPLFIFLLLYTHTKSMGNICILIKAKYRQNWVSEYI